MFPIAKRAKGESTIHSSTEDYISDEFQTRRSKRIHNGLFPDDEANVRKDPVSILLPEVFAEVYKYCSNTDLCQFRLVSSSWKNSVEEIWRKRVTIYISNGNTVGSKRGGRRLTEFLVAIQNTEFNFSNRPLRKFKFYRLELNPQDYNARSILVLDAVMKFCGSTISHLELSDCKFHNRDQFLRCFLPKFSNIKTLIITRLAFFQPDKIKKNFSSSINTGTLVENVSLTVFQNLSHLKIGYIGNLFDDSVYMYENMEVLFPWLTLLSSTPNLETLDIHADDHMCYQLGFRVQDVLRPIEMLSLENKLKKLKHIHILNEAMHLNNQTYDAFTRSIVEQSNTLQRSSLALKSLKFNAHVDTYTSTGVRDRLKERGGNEFMETLLKKFGTSDLQNLQLSTWKPYLTQFPPAIKGMSLEKLTHLSLHLNLGKTIKSVEQMPNLKSLEIWCIPPHERENNGLNNCTLIYLPADDRFVSEITNENDNDCHSDDVDYRAGDILPRDDPINMEVTQTLTHNIPAIYNEGNSHEAVFWEIPNPDACIELQFKFLKHFRFESESIVPQKFYSLPTWMPNLTSLEIPLSAPDFTIVCDQLRSLQRLVILQNPEYTYGDITSSPIDDCAITGKRHNSNSSFFCSCNDFVSWPRRKLSVNWSYFCGIGQPAVKPNITYLQELRHFEMEGLRHIIGIDPDKYESFSSSSDYHTICSLDIYLTDESVFDGFYKLPRLAYLNISAKLNSYTRKELFRRIPKCILRWPVMDECHDTRSQHYCFMQKF